MSGFSAAWLDLREPHDRRARDENLTRRLRQWCPGEARLQVVDLACGSGANLRYLAPRLGGRQAWLLLDHDPELLAAVPARLARWAAGCGWQCTAAAAGLCILGRTLDCQVRTQRCDLTTGLQRLPAADCQLVTCSALLDLVSAAWLRTLAAHCRATGAAVLWTLSYDGRLRFSPPRPGDAELRGLVNRHQRRDKGFGPALGPKAAGVARAELGQLGYRTWEAVSDWQIGTHQRELQAALLAGCAGAAAEVAPARKPALERWLTRRRAVLKAGRSYLRVGHLDLLGLPHAS